MMLKKPSNVSKLLALQCGSQVNKRNKWHPFPVWSSFVGPWNFGCHSGEYCAHAVTCDIINFSTGARCQATQDNGGSDDWTKKESWATKEEGYYDGSTTSAIASDFPWNDCNWGIHSFVSNVPSGLYSACCFCESWPPSNFHITQFDGNASTGLV